MHQKRVVVTGMGVISPLGLDVPTFLQNLIGGRSGIAPITLFDTSDMDVHIAGEAHGFDATDYMSAKDARRADRFTQFAIAALGQALAQSDLRIDEHNSVALPVPPMVSFWSRSRPIMSRLTMVTVFSSGNGGALT